MDKVIVTGAEGFIGSNLVKYLNNRGIFNILIVDSADNGYLSDAVYSKKMNIEEFTLFCITSTQNNSKHEFSEYTAVFHLGALVDTMSEDPKIMDYNLTFSQILFNFCAAGKIPFLYASSAAVYGKSKTFNEENRDLIPLNTYAKSKLLFDQYMKDFAEGRLDSWYGFRFFNVYGPNEWHKGRMTSAVTRIYLEALRENEIKLFRSIDPAIKDGYQMRDFIHVNSVIRTMYKFYVNREKIPSGIYNLGTGKAHTFIEIANQVNKNLKKELKIKFVDMPESIKDCYQSVTIADINKLSKVLNTNEFEDFESSISDHYIYLGNAGKIIQ